MAARTCDIFAELSAMLHFHATHGTGSDGGAAGDALHFWQTDGFARLQEVQVSVDAAVVVAAVRSRARTLPLSKTLPAELVGRLVG